MNILRWIAVSFSLYSRIPMPRFEWKDRDMACSLAFFPLIGVVIGALICLVNIPQQMQTVPAAVRVMLTLLVPLAITGGFHLDGFMDTEDALRSWAGREKRLEIMQDPHIGAFAVIGLLRCMLILACAVTYILLYEPFRPEIIVIFSFVFVTGRCLSAITSLQFKKARADGMLHAETSGTGKGVMLCLGVWLLLSVSLMLYLDAVCGAAVLAAFGLYTVYYRYAAYRSFGGVTGDTAGHFLVSAETVAAAVLAITLFLRK